jgi:hypothetical protein
LRADTQHKGGRHALYAYRGVCAGHFGTGRASGSQARTTEFFIVAKDKPHTSPAK